MTSWSLEVLPVFPNLVPFSLTYSQTVLKHLRENNLLEVVVFEKNYGVVTIGRKQRRPNRDGGLCVVVNCWPFTPPLGDSPTDGTFEDWTVLSGLASHNMNIHIYGPQRSPGSLVCFMCLVTVTTHADFCIGFTSTTSNIRATRVSRILHDCKHAR
jgi:hypothetical protein